MAEPFMSICPRNPKYIDYNVKGIPLKVIHSGGVDVSPHIKFTETELSGGIKYFQNNSGKSDSFSVSVLINKKDTIKVDTLIGHGGVTISFEPEIKVTHWNASYEDIGETLNLMTMLDYFIRNAMPFYVTTRAVGINEKDLYLITENKSRTQDNDYGFVVWDLTFTKYSEIKNTQFVNKNTVVKNAINKYNKKKKQKTKAKQKTTAKYKLQHKCKASQLKYSKTKKVVTCVKYMQQILYNKKFLKKKTNIDGWYGKTTKEALSKFQKKYKTKYKCRTDGNVDKNTFKALYSA